MARAVILSGGGRYADPWHPFGATSERLAAIVADLGHEVEIAEEVADRLVDLGGVDLLVVNAASGPPTDDPAAALAGVRAFLARGGGVLAVHVGASTLLDLPEWEAVTGMRWLPGISNHPPVGPSHVRVHPERHPIAAPLRDFDLVDERYCDLRLAADLVPFVTHDLEGRSYPLAWARRYGDARVVTDALGHGVESFDSPEHRELLRRSLRWLTGSLAAAPA